MNNERFLTLMFQLSHARKWRDHYTTSEEDKIKAEDMCEKIEAEIDELYGDE